MSRVWNKIDTRNLVYCSDWKAAESSVRAFTFGVMLELAQDRVKHYKSDLFHDAKWLEINLNGPMQFDWVCRESGTHIGDVTQYIKMDEWENAIKYRFEIINNDGKWKLNIYEDGPLAPPPSVPDSYDRFMTDSGLSQEVQDALVATDVNPINWTPDKVEEITEEYKKYFSDEPLPKEWSAELLMNGLVINIPGVFGPADGGTPKYEDKDSDKTFTEDDQGNWHQVEDFPTLRNTNVTDSVNPYYKENIMDSILRDLREKLDEANSALEEIDEQFAALDDKRDELDNAKGDLDSYVEEIENLINSLDSLPEVSIYVDGIELETVSFDS